MLLGRSPSFFSQPAQSVSFPPLSPSDLGHGHRGPASSPAGPNSPSHFEPQIKDCPHLQSLPTRLPLSLRILPISNYGRWNHWPDNVEDDLRSLLELEIEDCRDIESLPAQLSGSLKKLKVTAGCPEIHSLPVMPHSL